MPTPPDHQKRLHKIVQKQAKGLGFTPTESIRNLNAEPVHDIFSTEPADRGPSYNVGNTTYHGTISPSALTPQESYEWARAGLDAYRAGKINTSTIGLHPTDPFTLGQLVGAAAPASGDEQLKGPSLQLLQALKAGYYPIAPTAGITQFLAHSKDYDGPEGEQILISPHLTPAGVGHTIAHEFAHAAHLLQPYGSPNLESRWDSGQTNEVLGPLLDESEKGSLGEGVDEEALANEVNREHQNLLLERYKMFDKRTRSVTGDHPDADSWSEFARYAQHPEEMISEATAKFMEDPQAMRQQYPFLYEQVASGLENRVKDPEELQYRNLYQVVRPPGWGEYLREKARQMGISEEPGATGIGGQIRQKLHSLFGGGEEASPHASLLTPNNVTRLASILESEAGGGNDDEKVAVGSTVLNRLRGLRSASVDDVARAYSEVKQPTVRSIEIARNLLAGSYRDPTGGATHFYSPVSMPKSGQHTQGYDIQGGLERIPGLSQPNYRPGWVNTMEPVNVDGVSPARFRFYRPEELGGQGQSQGPVGTER